MDYILPPLLDHLPRPTKREIEFYDIMRVRGLTPEQAALAYVKDGLGYKDLIGATAKAVPSSSEIPSNPEHPGWLNIDFTAGDIAQKVLAILKEKKIAAVISPVIDLDPDPKKKGAIRTDRSSVYMDGEPFIKFLKDHYPDLTKDKTAFDKYIGTQLATIIKENGAIKGGLTAMRAQNLLKAAAAIPFPLDLGKIEMAADFLAEAHRLAGEREFPSNSLSKLIELNGRTSELVTKLKELEKLGTAPRYKDRRDGPIIDITEKGEILAEPAARGPSNVGSGSAATPADLTLSAKEAMPFFTNVQKYKYKNYVESFANGWEPLSALEKFNGTLGEFLGELTNPTSPMAVALKEVTKKSPVEEAIEMEKQFGAIYRQATNDRNTQKIQEAWKQNGNPWLNLRGDVASKLYSAVDAIDGQTTGSDLSSKVRDKIKEHAGKDSLEKSYEPIQKAEPATKKRAAAEPPSPGMSA